jgi:hypothetical protein
MEQATTSKKLTVTGWILSILPMLFLLMDAVGKLAQPEPVIKATLALGYPVSAISTLGILLIVCTIIYAIPRFSFIGAALLTGYLGGAVASNFRLGNPLFSHVLFPVYIALLLWAGLYLRNERLRALVKNK